MESSVIEQSSILGPWVTLLCVLGVGGTITFVFFLIKYANIGKEKAKYEQNELRSKIQFWFDKKIEEFTKKVLSYQINKLCIKQDVPMSIVDKLREKYGNEVICPVLNILEEFTNTFNCDLSVLDSFYKTWLNEHNIECKNTDYEKCVTETIIAKTEKEAQKIIDEYMSNKQEV